MSQEMTIREQQSLFEAAIDSRRISLPAPTWAQIFDILLVSASQQELAAREISTILTIGVVLYGTDQGREQLRDSLRALAKAGERAAALQEELRLLDESAKIQFENLGVDFDVARADINDRVRLRWTLENEVLPYGVFSIFRRHAWALRALDYIQWATGHLPRRRRGRPRRTLLNCPEIVAFEVAVVYLGEAADKAGWNLTLSHNTDSGTLIDVIRIIEPHMPLGFVPRVLNADRLRSLRSRGTK